MNTIFRSKDGKPVYVLGLQSHNSSNGCWEMIERDMEAVRQYHGNTLEVPIYWYQLEPEEGVFDFSMLEELIARARKNKMYLVLLWFGFSKNADLTYIPEWAKRDPARFRLAVTADGGVVPMISPHCDEAVEADKNAFTKLMARLRSIDETERTVLAVQVENEVGLYPTDRCYSKAAQSAYDKGVPDALMDVEIENSGANRQNRSWISRFGRYANEAFSAWYFALAIERIASAGKRAYPSIPLYMNTIVGEVRQELAGQSYSSGAPVGRVLEIWQKGAPSIELFAPDIYMPTKSEFLRVCRAHKRLQNPLFIPETGTAGDGFAINYIHAAAEYGALGICGFGAESTLSEGGVLGVEQKKVADSVQIIKSMSPLILKYGGEKQLFCVTKEEFQTYRHIEREKYHLTFHYTGNTEKGYPMGRSLPIGAKLAENPQLLNQRGRAIVCEVSPCEFYMAGIAVTVRFIAKPNPDDEYPMRTYHSRAATELTAITIEEGNFDENGNWIPSFIRRGDEIDCGAFLYPGIVLRVLLNPDCLSKIDW